MELLLLPGNSKKNEIWIHKVGDALSGSFELTTVHHYAHWKSGEGFISHDDEIGRVINEVKSFSSYIIFAKSIGSVLAIKGIFEGLLNPSRCIFVGLPFNMIVREKIPVNVWLKNIKTPILIGQNDNDPFGSFKTVKEYIEKICNPNITLLELKGDTHDYNDIEKIKELTLQGIL